MVFRPDLFLALFLKNFAFSSCFQQVGVQTEIEPDAGANALEDRVNAVMPLANKDDDNDEGK